MEVDMNPIEMGIQEEPNIVNEFKDRHPDLKVIHNIYPDKISKIASLGNVEVKFRCNGFVDDDKLLEVSYTLDSIDEAFQIQPDGDLRTDCTDYDKMMLLMGLYNKKKCFYVLDSRRDGETPYETIVDFDQSRFLELILDMKEYIDDHPQLTEIHVKKFISYLYFGDEM